MRTISMPFRRVTLIVLLFLLGSLSKSSAITYYSRTNGGLWTDPLTWSTSGYGVGVNTGTYPKKGDVVFIGDGYTVYMNLNAVCASVTVGQGASGNLEFSNYLAFTMTIAGTVTVNSGGRFGYAGNSSRAHSLFVSGNIMNNGTFDLYSDANDYVNLTFNSKINNIISGSGTFDLNKVTVFKSTSTAYYTDVQVNSFENAIRQLAVSYGTYIHNNGGTYNVNPTLGAFTISPDAIFKVPTGTMHFSPALHYVYLQGSLIVNGGNVKIGLSLGNHGIRYDQVGANVPSLTITSGSMEVYGGITYRSTNTTSPFSFNMSNGTLLLNSGSNGTTNEVFNVNDVPGSSFSMSNGIITLQKPTGGGTSIADFNLCGTSGTVSSLAGTVEFGNASTASGAVFNFVPYSGITQPNFKVTGDPSAAISLNTSNNSTSNFKLISLFIDVNKTFDIRSIAGTAGDSKTMTLVDNFDGLNALYNNGNFIYRTSTVIFQGGEGLWMSGAVATTFYNLTINNSFGVSLGTSANVSNVLTLTNGVLYSNSSAIITCLAGANSTIGSAASYVDGPFANNVASSLLQTLNVPIGKNGAYRPLILSVRHTNASTVTYTSESWNSSARTFGYTLPPTLTHVSDVRYYTVNRSAVANLNTARVTLSYGPDDVVNDFSNLRVAKFDGVSAWVDESGAGTANGSGSISSGSFSAFGGLFTLGNATGGVNPLPVTLVNFNAERKNNFVNLSWTTASEKNNDYFILERSPNALEFNSIAKMKGAANSNSLINYSFNDKDPLSGIVYYRLKQVDFDGTITYSPLKVVYPIKNSGLALYPNPIRNESFNMHVPEELSGEWTLQVIDPAGRVVYQQKGDFTDQNELNISAGSKLPEGSYVLRLTGNAGQQWQDRLVVVND